MNIKHSCVLVSNIRIIYFIQFLFFALTILLSGNGVSGEYYLIDQSHYHEKGSDDLCEKLVENFNRFKDDPPMVCERKFHSDFKEFSLPEWNELNPKKYIDKIDRILSKESRPAWNPGIPGLKKRILEGKVKLWKAKIDINFDGSNNTVYMMQEYRCDTKRDYTRKNMPRYRFMAEQNDHDAKQPRFALLNGNIFGGIFYYNGRPYLHSWIQWPLFLSDRSRSVEGPSPRIAIFETSSPHTYESFATMGRCEIGYREQLK